MENDVFVVAADRYWRSFAQIAAWVIGGSVFAIKLWRFARKGRAVVGGSAEGPRVWRRAVALIMALAGVLWLGVLAWLIPRTQDFQAFRLPAGEISEVRIDVYQEPVGVGRSELIKTSSVNDRNQIAAIIRLLGQSRRHVRSHESIVGRTYYLRFRDARSAEWRRERVDLGPTTDRGHGVQRTGIICLWVDDSGIKDRGVGPKHNIGPYFTNLELVDLVESLAGDK